MGLKTNVKYEDYIKEIAEQKSEFVRQFLEYGWTIKEKENKYDTVYEYIIVNKFSSISIIFNVDDKCILTTSLNTHTAREITDMYMNL